MEWWDSKWELDYMNELESDKEDGADTIKWTKNHGLQIKYFNSDNKFKTYNMLNKSVLLICFEREFVHGKIDDKKSKLK